MTVNVKKRRSSRDRQPNRVADLIARCGAILVLLVLLLPAGGCGQAEYERRMDKRMSELPRSRAPSQTSSSNDRNNNDEGYDE